MKLLIFRFVIIFHRGCGSLVDNLTGDAHVERFRSPSDLRGTRKIVVFVFSVRGTSQRIALKKPMGKEKKMISNVLVVSRVFFTIRTR